MSNTVQAIKAALRRAILPRPGPYHPARLAQGPIVVAGMFRTANGIGRAARACFDCLAADGLHPIPVDLSGLFNQVDQETDLAFAPMPKSRAGTLILFANAPETERALSGLGLNRLHAWQVIGCWAWELSKAPADWAARARFLSEIWAPSSFVRDSLAPDMPIPVRTVPHYVAPQPAAQPREGASETVTFLTLADGRSSLPRKNILAAMAMFRAAFPGNEAARLIVKCRNLDLFPAYRTEVVDQAAADPRIELIERSLNPADHRQLMASADVLVSTHRSEGFGLHLAEAMAMGRPVIATGWSGNLAFMTAENSILLPYTLIPVEDLTGIYADWQTTHWAEPDFDAGVRAFQDVFADPDYRAQLGKAGQVGLANALRADAYRKALENEA